MKKFIRTISALLTFFVLAGCTPTVPEETSAVPADVTPEPTEAIETTDEVIETTAEETAEEVAGREQVRQHRNLRFIRVNRGLGSRHIVLFLLVW